MHFQTGAAFIEGWQNSIKVSYNYYALIPKIGINSSINKIYCQITSVLIFFYFEIFISNNYQNSVYNSMRPPPENMFILLPPFVFS